MGGVQRLHVADESAGSPKLSLPVPVIAITTDIRYYSTLVCAAASAGLRLHWARSFERAMEMSRAASRAILVYDSDLPDVGWQWAVPILADVHENFRVLLAVPAASIDEEVWRSALAHRSYDIVSKTAGSHDLSRSLHFAFLATDCAAQQP